MATPIIERRLHQFFEIGVVLKAINAAVELLLGFLLLFVNVGAVVHAMTAAELVEDPTDYLSRHLNAWAGAMNPHVQLYSALYLISHGLIKAVLVYGLLRDKLWAYPASLAILALFVAYQSLTYLRIHSLPLLLLTLFDIVLIVLIYHEYRHHSRKRAIQ